MKKISNFIVKARYALLVVFVCLVGLNAYLMTRVNINYNMLIYLDKDSTSTVALNMMEDEFGSSGQAQVMVENVDFTKAKQIQTDIEAVDGVATVIFATGEDDSDYFIITDEASGESSAKGKALYKIFLKTSNYDPKTYEAVDDIRNILGDYDIALNGGAISQQFLSSALDKDMAKILVIVAVVVLLILTITSTSWVEPFLFLIIAGGAILINLGSNILLNHISYIGNSMSFITKAVAAVLQLALAMDYSIILLHAYKSEKENGLDKIEAIKTALAKSFAPVSASSITTIAGLVALMFMSFSIGFDVGLVLAKGILASLLCVFLFMPALLVLCDPLLEKTQHKTIGEVFDDINEKAKAKAVARGKSRFTYDKFQYKTRYLVPIFAVVLVVLGAILNFKSEYSFTLEASTDHNATVNVDDRKINNTFGTQNTLVVMLPKETYTSEEEQKVIDYMYSKTYADYGMKNPATSSDGKIVNSAQGMTAAIKLNGNTVGLNVPYTSAQISNALGFSQEIVDQLFAALSQQMGQQITAITMDQLITYLYNNLDSVGTIVNTYINQLQAEADSSAQQVSQLGFLNTDGTVNTQKVYDDEQQLIRLGLIDSNGITNKEIVAQYESQLKALNLIDDNDEPNSTVIETYESQLKALNLIDDNDEPNSTVIAAYEAKIGPDSELKLIDATDEPIQENIDKAKIKAEQLKALIDADSATDEQKVQYQELSQGIQLAESRALVLAKSRALVLAKSRALVLANSGALIKLDKNALVANFPFFKDSADELINSDGYCYNFYAAVITSKTQAVKAYGKKLMKYYNEIQAGKATLISDNYYRIIFNINIPVSGQDSFDIINNITDELYSSYNGIQVVSETFVYSQIKDVYNQDIVKVNLISFFAVLLVITITFRGAFVPVLLTVLIQGAIWVTMGISTLFGQNIFFLCYLVVMCIQMGATIDYGILLTTNYTRNRVSMDKKTAMAEAMKSSLTTIFTSGSILILATLIIGLVSRVSIISDLGLLLTRGCIISVLMIIFCLPQFLMLCDKIIEKTTLNTTFYNEKENVVAADAKTVEASTEVDNKEVSSQGEDTKDPEETK